MKLKNYYQILGITYKASLQEVKSAYRIQAKRWHPDMNSNVDTTSKMIDVIEAYEMLSNFEKRAVYDRAYLVYYKDVSISSQRERREQVVDDELKDIVDDARFKAEEKMKQFMAELKKTGYDAVKGFWSEAMPMLIVGVVMSLIFLMMGSC